MLNNAQIPIIVLLCLSGKILHQLYQNNLDFQTYLYYLQDIPESVACQRYSHSLQFLDNETVPQVYQFRLYFQIHVEYYCRRTRQLCENNELALYSVDVLKPFCIHRKMRLEKRVWQLVHHKIVHPQGYSYFPSLYEQM